MEMTNEQWKTTKEDIKNDIVVVVGKAHYEELFQKAFAYDLREAVQQVDEGKVVSIDDDYFGKIE